MMGWPMECNHCGKEAKTYKSYILHYAAMLCDRCIKSLKAEIKDVGWKYLKPRRENEGEK